MCRRVTCSSCNKPSWSGCGAHVEQVLGTVPPAERCQCRAAPQQAKPQMSMAEVLRLLRGR